MLPEDVARVFPLISKAGFYDKEGQLLLITVILEILIVRLDVFTIWAPIGAILPLLAGEKDDTGFLFLGKGVKEGL